MNWRTITALSAFGAAMGTASLFGYTQGIELYLWIGIAIVCGFVLVKRVHKRLLLHGAVVGVLDGIWNGIIEALFFSTYVANNAEVVARFEDRSFSLTPLFSSERAP